MAITDLSKWDFAVEFMMYEAAALIVGVEPAEIFVTTPPAKDNPRIYDYHEHPQIKPVADRMKLNYLQAIDLYNALQQGQWKHVDPPPKPESLLRDRAMEIVPLHITTDAFPLDQHAQDVLDAWRSSDEYMDPYEMAKFTRTEISRWLKAIGMKSKYEFDIASPASSQVATTQPGKWPWGNHHTKLLGHLEAAARRYWVNHDPQDTDTAPTNSVVSEWLQTERKVSRTMADAIASILRVDGLRTGPRK